MNEGMKRKEKKRREKRWTREQKRKSRIPGGEKQKRETNWRAWERGHAPPQLYSMVAVAWLVLLLLLLLTLIFAVPQEPQVLGSSSSSAAGTFRMDLYVTLTRLERTISSAPWYSTRSLEILCLNSYRLGPLIITKDLRANK